MNVWWGRSKVEEKLLVAAVWRGPNLYSSNCVAGFLLPSASTASGNWYDTLSGASPPALANQWWENRRKSNETNSCEKVASRPVMRYKAHSVPAYASDLPLRLATCANRKRTRCCGVREGSVDCATSRSSSRHNTSYQQVY